MNPAHSPIELSLIIVNWNAWTLLERCLASIAKYPAPSQEVIVVDNASHDGSAEKITRHFPSVRLMAEPINHGFSRANNMAARLARGHLLLFLNPDTEVKPSALERLVAFSLKTRPQTTDHHLPEPSPAVCGPRLLEPDGRYQPSARRFPSLRALLYQYTLFRGWRFWKRDYDQYKMRDFNGRASEPVATLMGSALLVPRSLFEATGGFDENFFIYFEEVDLQKRLRDAGHEVWFYPEAEVTHHGGASTGQCREEMSSIYLQSLCYYIRKHFGPSARWFCPLFKAAFLPKLLLEIPADLIHAMLYSLRGNRHLAARKRENALIKYRFLWRHLGRFSRS